MSSYPPPGTGPWPPPQSGSGNPITPEDRNWAVAAHIGSLLTAWFAFGFIAPLIVLLVRGPSSPFVRRHAVESLNFQLNALVISIVCAILFIIFIGFILIAVYGVFVLVCMILGTIRASAGEEYRYPLTLRVIH